MFKPNHSKILKLLRTYFKIMQMMYDKSSDMYDMNLGLWCWSQDGLPLLYNILRAFY